MAPMNMTLALLALLPLSASAAGSRQSRPGEVIKLTPAAGRLPARPGEVAAPAALPPAAAAEAQPEASAAQPKADSRTDAQASSVVPFSQERLASGSLERLGAAAGQGVKGEADMNLSFDGKRDGGGGDGPANGGDGVDFAQSVSQAHRDLLLKAIETHSDSFSGFFMLMGRPLPGFLWVVEAREDSPGAAAAVTRVVYEITPSSSRVSEEVQAPFWVAIDLRTGKPEFFTKDPDSYNLNKPFAEIIDNARDWRAIWAQLGESAPSVNFKTQVAVFVNEGVKGRGGYGVRIVLRKTAEGPVAVYMVDAPQGMAPTVMSRVFGFKVFPRSEAPIRVERAVLRSIDP